MKDRNPFKLNLILWSCVLIYSITMCIVSIFTSSNIAIIIHLCFVVFDSFFLGWAISNYIQYNKFANSFEEFNNYLKELIKNEDLIKNEPFKEFKSGKEERE